MRIISGYLGGRIIKVPDSKLIRPTTDRVRETLFNILNNKIDFEGISVLDLYAGSGSLGLEALSRGANVIHFVEKNFVIYNNLLNNLKSLNVENKCKIFKTDVIRFTSTLYHNYDLILADPPFFKDDIHLAAQNIFKNNVINPEGIFIIERSIQTKEKDVKAFNKEPFKQIGDTLLYSFEN